jgi:CDP-glucose 4,6-dehydratase
MIFVKGSVTDGKLLQETMREFEVDTVFHLAAQAKVNSGKANPVETFEANVQGTWNLLEAAVACGRKIGVMVASTDMVYANSAEPPYTEGSPVDAPTPYAASKLCAEMLAMCYYQTYGLPVCIARTSNVYGGGDTSFERIIPGTISSILHGKAPVIQSNGMPQREYLYVEDVVAGYMRLATAMDDQEIWGQTFNFSSGRPVRVLEVVGTILKLMHREDLKPTVLEESLSDTDVRHTSSIKATQRLGWHAETALEDGLEKTISWYQEHANELLTEAQGR